MTTTREGAGGGVRLRRRYLDRYGNYTDAPDVALVAAGRAGDEDALAALFLRYLPMVRAVCRRHLGRREGVEDAVQETTVRALQGLQGLRDPERVGAWLSTIAVRVCIDQIRRSLLPTDDVDHLVDEAESPIDTYLRTEVAAEVHAHLEQLSDRDRRMLWMRDAQGDAVPVVAREFGVTEGSARVLLTRARTRMRATYAQLVTAPMLFLRSLARRSRGATGAEIGWGAAVTQVGMVAALVLAPIGGTGDEALAADEGAPLAAAAAIFTDVSVTDRAADRVLAETAVREAASSAPTPAGGAEVPDDTFDAPWGDTDLGPVVVDDRPPEDADSQGVEIDHEEVVALMVDVQVDDRPPDAHQWTADLAGGAR